jgi:hypothetical protein
MMVQRQGGRLLQLGHGSSSSSSALQDQPVPPITEEAENMQDAIVAHAPSASSAVLSARLEDAPASNAEVPSPSGARSAQHAAQLLDLLEERDVKKKIEAKIAKAAAKAEQQANTSPKAPAPKLAAVPKAEAKTPLAKAPPPKPAAKPKAEAKTSLAKAPPPKLAAKPKTSPKAPAPKLAAKLKAKAQTSLAKAPAPKLAAKPKAKAKTEAPDQLPELPPGVTFQTELSRSQFLVRIKVDGKLTCKTFKWGDCSRLQFSEQGEARKAAIAFLKADLKIN